VRHDRLTDSSAFCRNDLAALRASLHRLSVIPNPHTKAKPSLQRVLLSLAKHLRFLSIVASASQYGDMSTAISLIQSLMSFASLLSWHLDCICSILSLGWFSLILPSLLPLDALSDTGGRNGNKRSSEGST
jgi:hypothetical protein